MVAAVAGFAGYYFSRANPTESAVQALMRAPLADLSGKAQMLSQWRGKVLVVNFWATWCLPCRAEIPALIKVRKQNILNSVEFVGIAFDSASNVRDYAKEMLIDYALWIGDPETLALSKDLGNPAGVLPFTVVLDSSGKVAYTHAGALTEAMLRAVLAPLL